MVVNTWPIGHRQPGASEEDVRCPITVVRRTKSGLVASVGPKPEKGVRLRLIKSRLLPRKAHDPCSVIRCMSFRYRVNLLSTVSCERLKETCGIPAWHFYANR